MTLLQRGLLETALMEHAKKVGPSKSFFSDTGEPELHLTTYSHKRPHRSANLTTKRANQTLASGMIQYTFSQTRVTLGSMLESTLSVKSAKRFVQPTIILIVR